MSFIEKLRAFLKPSPCGCTKKKHMRNKNITRKRHYKGGYTYGSSTSTSSRSRSRSRKSRKSPL